MKKLGFLLSLALLFACFGLNVEADDLGPPDNPHEMVMDIGQPVINYNLPVIQANEFEFVYHTAGDFLFESYAAKQEVEQILKYPFTELQGNCNTVCYLKDSEFASTEYIPERFIQTYFKEPVTKHRR